MCIYEPQKYNIISWFIDEFITIDVFINIRVFYVIHAHVSLYKDQTQTHSYMKF
jgi:hypothetical protein